MSIVSHDKAKERRIDQVGRIYAVVIGMALSDSVRALVRPAGNGAGDPNLSVIWEGVPVFVSFLVTLIPFWQGMNRHLDSCYLIVDKTPEGVLLFDLVIFFVDAVLLFMAGTSLRAGLRGFCFLGAVFVIDMIWSWVTHTFIPGGKHGAEYLEKWLWLDIVALLLALEIVAIAWAKGDWTFNAPNHPEQWPLWMLMALAIVRTIIDYSICWRVYFPKRGSF